MNLSLTVAERDYLEAVLKQTLGTLRQEVYHAEEARFKDDLKAEEALVRGVLAKLAVLASKIA